MRISLPCVCLLLMACAPKSGASEAPSELSSSAALAHGEVLAPAESSEQSAPSDDYPEEDPTASLAHEAYDGEFDGDIDDDDEEVIDEDE